MMPPARPQPVLAVLLLTAVAPALWGTTYFVTTEWLPADRPLLAGTLRALPAGLLLVAVTRTLPHGGWWWRAAVLGVLNIGAFFALLFVAAYRLPGGVAATLGAVQPLVVVALSAVLLHERVGVRARPGGRRRRAGRGAARAPRRRVPGRGSVSRPPCWARSRWPSGSSSPRSGGDRRGWASSPSPAGSSRRAGSSSCR